MADYRDLIAWQKAMALVEAVYAATRGFPAGEQYGLTSQICRAAVSVPSNIAEGQGRISRGEFKQFLGHARGSLFELETQLHLAQRLGFLAATGPLIEQTAELSRILNGLIASLRD